MRKSKLSPRGAGPFKVLHKAGDNAYVLELPEEYGVSPTFNVRDLTPFPPTRGLLDDSWSNPSKEGGIDEGSSGSLHPGAITRARAKEIEHITRTTLELNTFTSAQLLPAHGSQLRHPSTQPLAPSIRFVAPAPEPPSSTWVLVLINSSFN